MKAMYWVRQWNLTFFERLVYEGGASSCRGRGSIGSVRFCSSVAMEQWGPEHCAFVVETFFKKGESVTVTQRKFRLHFNVARHGSIPSRNTILLWVYNFRATASAMKKKQGLNCQNSGKTWGRAECYWAEPAYAMRKLWGCLTLLFGEFYTKVWTSTRTN